MSQAPQDRVQAYIDGLALDWPQARLTAYRDLILTRMEEGGEDGPKLRAAMDAFLDEWDMPGLKTGPARAHIDRFLEADSRLARFVFYSSKTRQTLAEAEREFLHATLIDLISIEAWPQA